VIAAGLDQLMVGVTLVTVCETLRSAVAVEIRVAA